MEEDIILAVFLSLPVFFGACLWKFAAKLRRRQTKAGWGQLATGNLLLLCVLVSLLPLSGEIYFRFFYDTTDSFEFSKVSVRWRERYWHPNLQGLRDNVDYPFARNPAKRRISFLGDSFTAGHGVKDVEDRFVNRLRAAEPEWEVHMLAMPGMDTGDELRAMKEAVGNGYEFDQVVLVYCLNDISDLLPDRQAAIHRLRTETAQAGWLRRNSYFANMLCLRYKSRTDPFMKDYFGSVLEAYRGDTWLEQRRRLDALREVIETNHGRLLVVTFPFLHAVGPDYPYAAVHEILDGHWRETKVPHLDLLPLYSALSSREITVNPFDAHPNERAHALAAEAIGKFLREQVTPSALQ